MLTELIYPDRFYIAGTMREIIQRLSEHSRHYITVKEMLDAVAAERAGS